MCSAVPSRALHLNTNSSQSNAECLASDEENAKASTDVTNSLQIYFSLRLSHTSEDPRRLLENAIEQISLELRDAPTLPASASDHDHVDLLALRDDAAIQLPKKHCTFRGCNASFSDDQSTVSHLRQSHADALQPAVQKLTLLVEDADNIHGQNLLYVSAYNEALACATVKIASERKSALVHHGVAIHVACGRRKLLFQTVSSMY